MVIFGTLAYLVVRLEPTVRLRRAILAAAAVLILGIGVSRLYLGVHYPTNGVAGYVAGFIWSTVAAFTLEVIRHLADRNPSVRGRERDSEKGIRPMEATVNPEEQ